MKSLGSKSSTHNKRMRCDFCRKLTTGFRKSVVFQALPVVLSCIESRCDKNIVFIVFLLLVNLMRDQVSHLNSLGISAISLSDISCESEVRNIESLNYSIMYVSPECWLGTFLRK